METSRFEQRSRSSVNEQATEPVEQPSDEHAVQALWYSPNRIPMHRSTGVIREHSIAIRPSRGQLLGPLIEIGLTLLAVMPIVLSAASLPLWLLTLLLLFALVMGPVGIIGLVFGAIGSTFLMERHKNSARWQQGFLGLGIGTVELVPFWRIARIEVVSDYDRTLSSGMRQDLVTWTVRLVKDNDRTLDIAQVLSPRPVLEDGLERANRLAAAIAAMCEHEVAPGVLPEAELSEAADLMPEGAAAPPRRRRRREPTHLPPPSAEA